jgi:hypothetical protein
MSAANNLVLSPFLGNRISRLPTLPPFGKIHLARCVTLP